MDTITSHYLKNKIDSENSTLKKERSFTLSNLNIKTKRIAFHIVWAILNFATLMFCFSLASGTEWEFIFFVATFIYCSLYWMIAIILFDKLIS